MAVSQQQRTRAHKYLQVQDLRRLRYLTFATRRMIEGHLAGRHSSRQRGHSIEFNDYRQYMPGDEIGDVDWKVYGRSDKLFIKLYEHETDLTVNLLIDASASMSYAGIDPGKNAISKYDQACHIAAAVAFVTLKQRDRVALGLARDGLCDLHRPQGSMARLRGLLELMERIRPAGRAGFADAITDMTRIIGRRGILVLFSDLLDDRDDLMKAIAQYMARGSEVIVFHTLHADELALPAGHNGLFIDSESLERVRLDIDDIRAEYEAKMKQFLHGWSQACKSRGIDYNLVSTGEHYHQVLERYLVRRSVRRR